VESLSVSRNTGTNKGSEIRGEFAARCFTRLGEVSGKSTDSRRREADHGEIEAGSNQVTGSGEIFGMPIVTNTAKDPTLSDGDSRIPHQTEEGQRQDEYAN